MSRLRHARSQGNGQNSIRPENIDPDDHIKKLQEINANNQKESIEQKQNDIESEDKQDSTELDESDTESDDEQDSTELDESDTELDESDTESDDEQDSTELDESDTELDESDTESDSALDNTELDEQDDIEADKPNIAIIAPSSRRKNTSPNPEEQIRIVPQKDNKAYPTITSSSFKEPYTEINNEKIVKTTSYTAIGTTAVAIASSFVKLYYSCANQLGTALGFTQAKGSAQLVQKIMNQNILTFLSMNEEGLAAISGVGKKIEPLMNFYKPFISNIIVTEKSFNAVTDFGKLLHKPNANNIIKLAVDVGDTIGTYYESPYTAIFPIGNAGYLAYKGEYTQAGEQVIMAASYVLPLIMNPANPAALAIVAGIGIATTYNFYTALNDYKNDAEDIDSITSYKELYKSIPESIFNTSEKIQELEASINNNNKIIEIANLKKFTETKGDFGAKLAKHIYLPVIEEKYELLNQVSQRKITQEESDQLQTKHYVIELENRLYDHCIEVKNKFYDPNKDYYHCYIKNDEILDRVIIGENNTVEKVELEA